jgi:hypothetical protein
MVKDLLGSVTRVEKKKKQHHMQPRRAARNTSSTLPSGDNTTSCKVTPVILHEVASPDAPNPPPSHLAATVLAAIAAALFATALPYGNAPQ